MEEQKDNIFKIIQTQLKNPPVIIWGSGATIPFGLPSMGTLTEVLKNNIADFDKECENLEVELGKEKYQGKMPEIKRLIWDTVSQKDEKVLDEIINDYSAKYKGIELLAKKFIDTHPRLLNIITTNYDRVLEHVLAYSGIPYSDGFSGKNLSIFSENSFPSENIVNLIKVHGSLNWFLLDGDIRYLGKNENYEPQIICPGRNKFQEAYSSPYRELIQKSDSYINNAMSFLVVGFGFNDEHLTPKIRPRVKMGIPIIVITKTISESSFKELEQAERYVLMEEADANKTRVIYKENVKSSKKELIIEGSYWSLNNFIEII
jgi:hypothetical protein